MTRGTKIALVSDTNTYKGKNRSLITTKSLYLHYTGGQGGKQEENIMETRKYPLTDKLKETTSDALDELARRLIDEAAAVIKAETPTGKLLAAELLERAAELREASDYFLNL